MVQVQASKEREVKQIRYEVYFVRDTVREIEGLKKFYDRYTIKYYWKLHFHQTKLPCLGQIRRNYKRALAHLRSLNLLGRR